MKLETAIKALQSAEQLDPEIRVKRSDLDRCTGATESYLIELGLDRRTLKTLEKAGVAIRGYLPTASGHSLRWILTYGEE